MAEFCVVGSHGDICDPNKRQSALWFLSGQPHSNLTTIAPLALSLCAFYALTTLCAAATHLPYLQIATKIELVYDMHLPAEVRISSSNCFALHP